MTPTAPAPDSTIHRTSRSWRLMNISEAAQATPMAVASTPDSAATAAWTPTLRRRKAYSAAPAMSPETAAPATE